MDYHAELFINCISLVPFEHLTIYASLFKFIFEIPNPHSPPNGSQILFLKCALQACLGIRVFFFPFITFLCKVNVLLDYQKVHY